MASPQYAASPGWYPDPTGRHHYWDGAAWTATRLSDGERADILNRALIEARVKAPQVRVESQSAHQAVLVYGREANHVLHLLVALFTCGFWFIVWAFIALASTETRVTVTVDPYGKVTWVQ